MRIAGGTAKRITKRIINFIFVIWGVVTLSFCLQVFTGTDPAEMIVRKVNVFATEEQIQAVREELGLDAPFLERYADYIKSFMARCYEMPSPQPSHFSPNTVLLFLGLRHW